MRDPRRHRPITHTECPVCGSKNLSRKPKLVPDERCLIVDGRVIEFSMQQWKIIEALNDCYPRAAPRDLIMERVYGDDQDDPDWHIIDTRLVAIRKALEGTRLSIRCVREFGFAFEVA